MHIYFLLAISTFCLCAQASSPTPDARVVRQIYFPIDVSKPPQGPAPKPYVEPPTVTIKELGEAVSRVIKPPYSKGAILSHLSYFLQEAKRQEATIRAHLPVFLNQAIELGHLDSVKELIIPIRAWVHENNTSVQRWPLQLAEVRAELKERKESQQIYAYLLRHHDLFEIATEEEKQSISASRAIMDIIADGDVNQLRLVLPGYKSLGADAPAFLIGAIYQNSLPLVKAIIEVAGARILMADDGPAKHAEKRATDQRLSDEHQKTALEIYQYLMEEALCYESVTENELDGED